MPINWYSFSVGCKLKVFLSDNLTEECKEFYQTEEVVPKGKDSSKFPKFLSIFSFPLPYGRCQAPVLTGLPNKFSAWSDPATVPVHCKGAIWLQVDATLHIS